MNEPTHNSVLLGGAGVAVLFLIAATGVVTGIAILPEVLSPAPEGQTAATVSPATFAEVSLEAKAAILIDVPSGRVLYEKNAGVPLPLASLTKVALALVVAEALPLDRTIAIPHYIGASTRSEHLSQGEHWLLDDVIDFTLVTSSNSGAELLAAEADEPIRERFLETPRGEAALWRMNDLAKNLHLEQTYFLNVSGLDLSTTQAGSYGSARDMAALFAYAASADPSLFAGTAKSEMLLTSTGAVNPISAINTNTAQGTVPGLILGKTGFTELAGGNLAIVFDVGLAHPVVAVVLGSSEAGRFEDMHKLIKIARQVIGGETGESSEIRP